MQQCSPALRVDTREKEQFGVCACAMCTTVHTGCTECLTEQMAIPSPRPLTPTFPSPLPQPFPSPFPLFPLCPLISAPSQPHLTEEVCDCVQQTGSEPLRYDGVRLQQSEIAGGAEKGGGRGREGKKGAEGRKTGEKVGVWKRRKGSEEREGLMDTPVL